jgi:hypothetical protein
MVKRACVAASTYGNVDELAGREADRFQNSVGFCEPRVFNS